METRFTFDYLNTYIVGQFNSRVANVQKAGAAGLRSDTGHRLFWEERLPTGEERTAAKNRATDPWSFNQCPLCRVSFQNVMEYTSLRDHGLCHACKLRVDGLLPGVIAVREPTLAEALAAPEGDILPAEAEVIKAELTRRISQEKGLDGSCPVCRLGEVEGGKCSGCGARFCLECGGTLEGRKSANVGPCVCPHPLG
jgi:hypothetical protein